ncbi:DNA-3-methyladenine glycosylase [Isobaculum melis]|uniref:Putative 3-methyladenine DNA glycosylase n=1 Tax=Isobaculum melis TaxID=142588 RepID=A0A1H9TFX2_9LACT|nr:DNA-3-methyladenine glycosylase [Isobaculum melis]SER96018.1 DNA-3-methyladenine glycosylase [Isobaculum melis]
MDFIEPATTETAKALLGKLLLHETEHGLVGGYIVETEAYVGAEDRACHTFDNKRTPRLASMYEKGGTIYIYSMHTQHMLNIVTKEKDMPEAVLIRAIQPLTNQKLMIKNRGKEGLLLTNGPGKLTQALAITTALDGQLLNEGKLFLHPSDQLLPKAVIASPRIGIPNKGKWTAALLRYHVAGNPYVSGMKKREMLPVHETW